MGCIPTKAKHTERAPASSVALLSPSELIAEKAKKIQAKKEAFKRETERRKIRQDERLRQLIRRELLKWLDPDMDQDDVKDMYETTLKANLQDANCLSYTSFLDDAYQRAMEVVKEMNAECGVDRIECKQVRGYRECTNRLTFSIVTVTALTKT